jgi:hypothetical protein
VKNELNELNFKQENKFILFCFFKPENSTCSFYELNLLLPLDLFKLSKPTASEHLTASVDIPYFFKPENRTFFQTRE